MDLRTFLADKQLSQAAFGALLNPPVTQSLVSQWIRGEVCVTLHYALQITALSKGKVTPAELDELVKARSKSAVDSAATAA